MWKRLITTNDLIVQEAVNDGLNVRIEARNNPEGWNIIKRYYLPDDSTLSYTEDYSRPTLNEAKEAIRYLQGELLTKMQIKKIKNLKKSLDLRIIRVYHEGNVEKWFFTIHSMKRPQTSSVIEDGTIVIKYGDTIEVDVMVKEKFRHFEEEIIEAVNEKFGLTRQDEKEVIHNFYYYFETTAYTTKQKRPQVVSGNTQALLVR